MFIKVLKYLKQLDVFKQPTYTFSTERNKYTNEKKYPRKHGSSIGGVLSIVFVICVIAYTSSELNSMSKGKYDNYHSYIKTNPLTEELSE